MCNTISGTGDLAENKVGKTFALIFRREKDKTISVKCNTYLMVTNAIGKKRSIHNAWVVGMFCILKKIIRKGMNE